MWEQFASGLFALVGVLIGVILGQIISQRIQTRQYVENLIRETIAAIEHAQVARWGPTALDAIKWLTADEKEAIASDLRRDGVLEFISAMNIARRQLSELTAHVEMVQWKGRDSWEITEAQADALTHELRGMLKVKNFY